MDKKKINTPAIIFALFFYLFLFISCSGGSSSKIIQDEDTQSEDTQSEQNDTQNDEDLNSIDEIIELNNGDIIPLSLNQGENRSFSLSVPADATALLGELSEMNGDMDIYTRFGELPTQEHYDCRPFLDSDSSEICYYDTPPHGEVFYIFIIASTSGSATLKASYLTDEMTAGIDFGKLPDAVTPWSSWFWPWADDNDPNLYDDGEALQRYDQYTQTSDGQAWEYEFHGPPQAPEEWYGACHAWSGAACWHAQPTQSRSLDNIKFRIRDQKGLMTAAYYNCGRAINHEINASQPSPGLFWKLLQEEIQGKDPMHGQAHPLIGELSYGDQVWNHPIYRYEVSFSLTDNIADGTITIWCLSDALASYADTTDLFYHMKTYQFTGVKIIAALPTDSGEWVVPDDPELMPHHRPDIIWRPYRPSSWTTYAANPQLDDIHLAEILDEN
jgi:hypothetical protein